jgi:hypothetical protein
MKITPRIAVLLAVPVFVSVGSACGGPPGSPSSTNGTSISATASTVRTTQPASASPSANRSAPGNGSAATNNQVNLDPETPMIEYEYLFGVTRPGISSTLQFSVVNDSTQSVQIEISTTSSYFTPSDNCNTSLSPDESCSYSITFNAPTNGTYSANLVITYNGSPVTAGVLNGTVGATIIAPVILRTFIGSTQIPITGTPTQTAGSPTQSTGTPTPTVSTSAPSPS